MDLNLARLADRIVAASASAFVDTTIAEQQVASAATDDQVVASLAVELISSVAPEQPIMARAATHEIVPRAGIDGVISAGSDDDVVAGAATQFTEIGHTVVGATDDHPVAHVDRRGLAMAFREGNLVVRECNVDQHHVVVPCDPYITETIEYQPAVAFVLKTRREVRVRATPEYGKPDVFVGPGPKGVAKFLACSGVEISGAELKAARPPPVQEA